MLPHGWAWFCSHSWSAGSIIRVKFSMKTLPDVLLIAEANIPAAGRKTGSSWAAKALGAQRAEEKEASTQECGGGADYVLSSKV